MKPGILIAAFISVFSLPLLAQPSILEKWVKVERNAGTVSEILEEISEKGGFYFSYGDEIPDEKYLRLSRSRQTVRGFLDEINPDGIYLEYGNKLMIKLKPAIPDVYTVKGRVVESDTRLPIPGVTVIIPGTESLIGTSTGEDGTFSINIPLEMDVIQFSCIGFESKAIRAGKQPRADISLDTKKMEITEAEIIVYNSPVIPEMNLAVSYIRSDILERIPAASIDQVLQGNASGVHVVGNSGMPGATLQVRIRGHHSLINSDPVYYLDGIPLQYSSLQALSPHDIASIEVRKDASSASLFGSSAANGVVLLESSTGEKKDPGISVYHHTGIQQVRKTLDLLNTEEFMDYRHIVLPDDDIFKGMDTLYSDENQMEHIFHDALVSDTHLSYSSENEKSDFYLGTGYFTQSAIIKDLKFRRYNFSVNSNHRLGKRLKLGQLLSFAYIDHQGLREGSFLNDLNNPILTSMIALPFIRFNDSIGGWFFPGEETQITPYVDRELERNRRENYAFNGMVHGDLEITPSIRYKVRLGSELFFQDNLSYTGRNVRASTNNHDYILENYYNVFDHSYHLDNSLVFARETAGGHKVKGNIWFGADRYYNQWIPVSKLEIYQTADSTIISDLTAGLDGITSKSWNRAYAAAFSYQFRERLQLELAFRNDVVGFLYKEEIKKFQQLYPSASLGYIFLDNRYKTEGRILSYGKLRFSYGEAGNSPRLNYSFFARMRRDLEYVYAFRNVKYNTSSADIRQTNDRFFWEHSRANNLGIDLGLFNNRVSVSMDLFRNHLDKDSTCKIEVPTLFTLDISQMNQYSCRKLPVAEVLNTGFDLSLTYKYRGRDLQWEINSCLSHVSNHILDVDSATFDNIYSENYDPISVNLPGETAGSFFGYRIEKMFTEEDCTEGDNRATNQPFVVDDQGNRIYAQPDAKTGDYKYMDLNGDSKIDRYDKTIIGNPFPKFIFGINAYLKYKNLDFSMLWQGSYGNQIYNATKLWLYNPYGATNWSSEILNSYRATVVDQDGNVTDPGVTDTDLHRFDYYAENENLRVSEFYIEDGSYIRLKYLQAGLTVNSSLLSRIHVGKFRIFVTLQNILTFTAYSGLDPEVGGWGIDCGIYPQPRTYMLGINMDF